MSIFKRGNVYWYEFNGMRPHAEHPDRGACIDALRSELAIAQFQRKHSRNG